jgi:hypothetical protein
VSPDVNSAQVVIKRERAWSGSLLPWTVWLDGQKVGAVHVGGSLTVPTSPGQHDIVLSAAGLGWVSMKSEPFRFHAETGDRIDLVTQASAVSGRPKISHQGMPASRPPLTGRIEQAAAQWQKNWSTGQQSSGPTSAEPVTAAPKSPAPATSTVVEGSRYEVPLGEETRTIDNSKSSSSTTRVVRITREWAKTYTLDIEHNMTIRGSAGLGIHVLDLKAEAERMLRNTYSATSEERETFAEEVTLNIIQHTKSEIIFSWKEIRQKGIVQISGADFEAQIPYEVVVGITFDQQQVDTP